MAGNKSNLRVKRKSNVLTRTPKLFKVVLLNDDFTPMQFVVDVLISIFGKGYAEAVAIMLKVHNEGQAICGEYPKEIADTKVELTIQLARRHGYPLQAVVSE